MATSAWSTEAWTDTQASAGGVTDLTKILWQADWSDLADGTSLNGATGEAYGVDKAGRANVSSVRTLNGRKSARETVGPDDVDGDGAVVWLGFEYAAPIGDVPISPPGTEVWFRIWFYNESGYVYECDVGHRKTIRFGEVDANNNYSGGWGDFKTVAPNDFYSSGVNTMMYGRESFSGYKSFDPNDEHVISNGRWICMEAYTKQGLTEETGEVRMWMDGVPMAVHNTTTMYATNTRVSRLLYINYWNAGIPKDVTQSWCAPAVAVRNANRDDTPHMAADANGFPFIGTIT